MKKLAKLLFLSLNTNIFLFAQVKIGSNPTSINSNKNLEIEATSGKKVNVNKDDGRTYIENKPSAALTDSVVLRYTDGELRQMSVARLVKFIQDSEDTDGDGIPNGTDPDDDGDGIQDTSDKCPLLYGCASNPINGATHGCPVNCFTVPGAITALNCSSASNTGTLLNGTAASGVTSVISYTGGNGGAYTAQSISSTGVTGLTASITAGNFATGSGTLTVAITGTPSGSGTASFALSIGGQTCTLTRGVSGNIVGTNCSPTDLISSNLSQDPVISFLSGTSLSNYLASNGSTLIQITEAEYQSIESSSGVSFVHSTAATLLSNNTFSGDYSEIAFNNNPAQSNKTYVGFGFANGTTTQSIEFLISNNSNKLLWKSPTITVPAGKSYWIFKFGNAPTFNTNTNVGVHRQLPMGTLTGVSYPAPNYYYLSGSQAVCTSITQTCACATIPVIGIVK